MLECFYYQFRQHLIIKRCALVLVARAAAPSLYDDPLPQLMLRLRLDRGIYWWCVSLGFAPSPAVYLSTEQQDGDAITHYSRFAAIVAVENVPEAETDSIVITKPQSPTSPQFGNLSN